ncbi:hypothetical protein IAE19_13320 [Acinetobacter sp. S40]|uniref:hypothetical protein n=1 Tax=unclassified Acinetobacter TaxID=196816 RepID=UPI00190DA0F1|nr:MULTISPECIES: hypothetical protein [unclassified Acinetobacter]MBJ9986413.1 hypothetical protein [Acinetobacter sp. S40]MBK0063687.1 hypothetical protein [Acinetobacter sp. S55]MBK0067565.1 hypothetical protein [Acinetobacter sp. S54]
MTSKDQIVTDQTLSPSEQLAQALLLEQVGYFKQQLTGEHSSQYLQHITHLIFNNAQSLKLGQVVDLDQLQAVVQRYALEMQLGAGLLEFIGEIAQKIYLYALSSTASVNDLVSDQQFEIWLSKFLELDNVRIYLNQFLKSSPAIRQLCHFIATTVLQNKLPILFTPSVFNSSSHEQDEPAWKRKLLKFSNLQQQRLEQKLEVYLAEFIQQQLAELSILTNEDLEILIRNIWDDVKEKTIYQYISQLKPIDIEEFFVLIYEYWKELRQSPLIQNLILHGVEVFYRFYENESLQDLLFGIGLTEQDIQTEALRFYPKAILALDEQNLLEPLIFNLLKPFYIRSETLTMISKHLT